MSYSDTHHQSHSSATFENSSSAEATFQYRQYPQLHSHSAPHSAPLRKYNSQPEIASRLSPPALSQLSQLSAQGTGSDINASLHHPSRPLHALYPAPTHLEQLTPPNTSQSHNWTPLDNDLALGFPANMPYGSYSNPSSFPQASRLTPPLTHHSNGGSQIHGPPRLTLAGSLDPTTGIFYRTPEHPRLRTAQACEKCRTRKAKCSGDHPSCNRCITRGLICEYAKEGRVRGPNKPKNKSGSSTTNESRPTSRGRAPSTSHNVEHPEMPPAISNASRNNADKRLSLPILSLPASLAPRRNSLSLGEHRSSRPRPPDLRLDSASNHYRLDHANTPLRARVSELASPLIPPSVGFQPSFNRFTSGPHLQSAHPYQQNISVDSSLYGSNSSMSRLRAAPFSSGISTPVDETGQFMDEGGSSCSSSSASMAGQGQGRQALGHTQSTTDLLTLTPTTYLLQHHRDNTRPHSDERSQSNPHSAVSLTFNSAPTSATSSPVTPVSPYPFFNQEGVQQRGGLDQGLDLAYPELGQQPHNTSNAVWADVARPNISSADFVSQFRRSEKNGPGWEGMRMVSDNNNDSGSYHHQGTDRDQASFQFPTDHEMR